MSDPSIDLKRRFLDNTKMPSGAQFDWLTRRGVPDLALAYDGDGRGWPIGTAKLERVGQRFAFRPEDGTGGFVVMARDEAGAFVDLVAWEPRAGWALPWLGDAPVLGAQDIVSNRRDGPLPVHRDALGWLRAGRRGVVILNAAAARPLLDGYTLQAEEVEHGDELRRVLAAPRPRIVVPVSSIQQVA